MPKDNDDPGMNFSDTSSSVATVENYEEERRRERRRKKSKKSHRRRDDESDSDDDERRHRRHSSSKSDKKKKRHKKSSKRKKDHRKRHKKDHDDEDNSSHESSRSDNENDSRRRHKHSRKERKRRRKGDAHEDSDRKKKSKGVPDNSAGEKAPSSGSPRGQIIAKALHDLLTDKPDFSSELPLVLIRLAGGTTFDLRQVTDPGIAMGLQAVFESLQAFGVQKQENSGMWMFQNPPGASRRDELVLLRVVRSFLDDVGVTMEEVVNFDEKKRIEKNQPQPAVEADGTILEQEERQNMKELTFKILEKFRSKDATLGSQLASLCMTIVDGESVSVDGIPDDDLKAALESLFQACGLEKSEIEEDEEEEEDDDDDDNESDESPLMGYGLSASGDSNNDVVQMKLATIMAACREGPPKRKSVGPMRRPATAEEEQAANAIYGASIAKKAEEEDEDDGPLLPGEARRAKQPAMSLETIKAQAEYRELELKSAAAGVPMPSQNGGREEWMMNPGEHTFLDGIKSGTTIKSRGFQNKKARGGEDAPQVHPAVQAEMDAIMHAHENARGPSLMDIYQSKKAQEKELAASASNGKNEFKWSRDADLDAGRRVDKNALGMILGGAADNLKTKFAGGFNR